MKTLITLASATLAVAGVLSKVVAAARFLRPMKHHRSFLLCLAPAAAFLAGCASNPGPDEQLDTTKYTIESTGKFVRLDELAQASVTCTGLQERILPDGRLQVQINCVFKDEQGVSTGDETPFRNLILTESATQAVQFTSVNNQARKYTIRVREAR